jgi:molybdopterin/thiamine biosynthesis adenylyltransferase
MDHTINELYDRQESLCENFSETSTMVIGCGGIGNWVSIDLALLGIGTVVLIDPDKIEASNLNRTLFRLSDIGKYKTEALSELISERRPDCIIIAINEYFNISHLEKYNVGFIFDCTDTLNVRSQIKGRDIPYVKCGYDGFSGTLCFNDFESGKWGEEGSYTVIPSFFGTPQILSALAVIQMIMEDSTRKETITFDVNSIIDKLNPKEEEIDADE